MTALRVRGLRRQELDRDGGIGAEQVWLAPDERPFDRADYVRRLNALPGDWPPPEELGLR